MRKLRCTVGRGDDFRQVMACHCSTCDRPHACIGYAAVEGYSNINVRLMASRGELNLPAIWKEAEGIELWDSFEEMLEAYEEAQTGT